MGVDLVVALIAFAGSAGSVIFLGGQLAKFGDALASLTGLGRLFVGSILIALATSLPELSTNISAVRLDPPNPELAVGNIFGANMVNMFTLSIVALLFGGKAFLDRVAPEQAYLIVLASIMTGAAVILGAVKWDVSLWQIGPASVIFLALFLSGTWIVYLTRPKTKNEEEDDDHQPEMSLARAWVMFGLVSAGVVIAGFFLAWSSDQIAEITGIASSTLGILAVAFVTTMPAASATYFAARMGAMDLGVSGLFGSCVFNVAILGLVDPLYRDGVLINQTVPAHFAAGGIAIGLLLVALMLIIGRDRIGSLVVKGCLVLMALVYIAGAVLVIRLGAAEGSEDRTNIAGGFTLAKLDRWSGKSAAAANPGRAADDPL